MQVLNTIPFPPSASLPHRKIERWSVRHIMKVVVSSKAAEQYIRANYGDMFYGDRIEIVVGKYFGSRPHGFDDKASYELFSILEKSISK